MFGGVILVMLAKRKPPIHLQRYCLDHLLITSAASIGEQQPSLLHWHVDHR
jgi:hypothetical protein